MAGRGSRTNTCDMLPDNYDPMKDDFNNPELNSYDTGPGSHMKQNKPTENTKLHITNIPVGLTEEGLLNIFSSEGDIPESVYIHKKNFQTMYTSYWGFVTYKSVAAAQNALFANNKRPPYNFCVQFARCYDDDRSEPNKDRHFIDKKINKSPSQRNAPRVLSRGKLPPMQGLPPSAYKSICPNEEPFIDDLGDENFPSNFLHCGTSYEQDAANSVFSPYADFEYDNGKRKMTMGRGAYIACREIPDVENIYEEHQDLEHSVAAYLGYQSKDLLLDADAIISSESKLSLPIKPGVCEYCSRPAIYICSACKSWYCTNYCRKQHWNVHKNVCVPRQLKFQDGVAVYTILSDTSNSQHLKENYLIGSGHDNQNNNTISHNSVYSENGRASVALENFQDSDTNKTGPNFKDFSNPGKVNEDFSGDEKRFKKIDQRCYSKVKKNIFVKSSPPLLDVTDTKSQRKVPANFEKSPIQPDSYTKVTIGAVGSYGEFCAYKVEDYKKQADIMSTLNKYSSNGDTSDVRFETGAKCCALYEGDWYRAEIIETYPISVKVKFIDFGNQSEVFKRKLITLPKDLSLEPPPMAHRFVLASSLNNPILEEDLTLSIKPVLQDVHGRWVVQIEGVTYPETYEEVTISVTETNDVYWVYKNEDLFFLMDMTSNLGEHKDVIVNEPLVDEIYVHFFNNSWCRGKIISENPLKIEYIDYGNNDFVERRELHPLPKKYEMVPPLAFKIKLIEETSSSYYNLKPISKLLIKEVYKLKDGTKICYVQGNGCSKQVKHFLSMLENNKLATLQIEKVKNEQFLTGSIMDSSRIPVYLEISKVISNEVNLDNDLKLVPGMTLAAKWNNDWYRGYLMLLRDKKPLVALVDKGRVVIPQEVAPLPKKVLNIPESGVRVIFEKPLYNQQLDGELVDIQNIQHDYKNNCVLGEIEGFGPVAMLPWVPALEEAGLECMKIPSGSKVMITSYHSPSAIYVQSCNPKIITIRSEIVQDVASFTKGESLKRKPLIGEYLACRYIEDGYYYRAQIFKKVGDKYKVTFVDYGNTEVVSQTDMKQLPDELKKIPCCAVKVGLKDVPSVTFNTESMRLLNELAADMAEMFIDYDKDLSEVTLKLKDGCILNKVLFNFLEPSWKKTDYNPMSKHIQIFMGPQIIYETWEKGSQFEIAVGSVIKHDSVLALRPASGLFNHVEHTLTPMITAYCESRPDEQYNPRKSEVCLAKFHEDGKWYRAVCLQSFQRNTAQVFFLDYGNSGEVLFRCIRKMVPEFMEVPAALNYCKIFGLPKKVSQEVASKLEEYFSTLRTEAVVLEEEEDENCVLWLPILESHASRLGITVKHPRSF